MLAGFPLPSRSPAHGVALRKLDPERTDGQD